MLVAVEQEVVSTWLVYLGVVGYLLLFLSFHIGWQLAVTRYEEIAENDEFEHITEPGKGKAAIIVAARNEEIALPALLNALEGHFAEGGADMVVLVNDNSKDGTEALMRQWQTKMGIERVQVLSTANHTKPQGWIGGKKWALQLAVERLPSDIELVLHTDADCRPGPEWAKLMLEPLRLDKTVVMCTGPVSLTSGDNEKTLGAKLLDLEMVGLVGVGAATRTLGLPTMCNGANLAYRKTAFLKVGGHKSHAHLASGDDEFLMQNMAREYGVKAIPAVTHKDAIVETNAPETMAALVKQRGRWASKSLHYTNKKVTMVMAAVWLIHLGYLLTAFLGYGGLTSWVMLISRPLLEVSFLAIMCFHYGKEALLKVSIIALLLYPFYVVSVGVYGNFGRITWKQASIKQKNK